MDIVAGQGTVVGLEMSEKGQVEYGRMWQVVLW